MNIYEITNIFSGVCLGYYNGNSVIQALEAMAKDAGYSSYAALCKLIPPADGELEVTLITE